MAAKVLIIGASGFIGSHLLREFESKNIAVKVMARNVERVNSQKSSTQIVHGDLNRPETLKEVLSGIETVYYLAHAMADSNQNFEGMEIQQAKNLNEYLTKDQRVIYLGGIIPSEKLSKHLRARKSVGDILRSGAAQVIEFRASIIIGNGSASFEIIRAIIHKVPLIITSKWSRALCQPISINDAITYLYSANTIELDESSYIFNIGGSDVVAYEELLIRYAKFKGLYRPQIYLGKLPKELALSVLDVIVPEHYEVAKGLFESIEHETIVRDDLAQLTFKIKPQGLDESFKSVQEKNFSDINLDHVVDSFLSKKKFSDLVGESLHIFIPLARPKHSKDIETFLNDFIHRRKSLFTSLGISIDKFLIEKKIEFKIPTVGNFNLIYLENKHGFLLAIKPLYFFQSLGISLLKKILWQK